MCAARGTRNKLSALSQMVLKDISEWEEEAADLEDKIYLYTTFKSYFFFLAAVWWILLFILIGIVLGLTSPIRPSVVGTDEVCGAQPHCNGQGSCDALGECWCLIGLFTSDSNCETVSEAGIFAIVFFVIFLFISLKSCERYRYFKKELVTLHATLGERMEDLEKMIKEEQAGLDITKD